MIRNSKKKRKKKQDQDCYELLNLSLPSSRIGMWQDGITAKRKKKKNPTRGQLAEGFILNCYLQCLVTQANNVLVFCFSFFSRQTLFD